MPTTPANYFHALRRQMRRNFRKPLVVLTPKSLLRHKTGGVDAGRVGPGTVVPLVILAETDAARADAKVRRVVLCSGKVYYDLLAERRKRRIERRRHPAARAALSVPGEHGWACGCRRIRNAEVVWCQEEPENMGAWNFVDRRIERVLAGLDGKATRPVYVGRPEAAAPATGSARAHVKEQAELVDRALTLAEAR